MDSIDTVKSMPAREMDVASGVTVKSQGVYKQGPEKTETKMSIEEYNNLAKPKK